MSSDINKSLDHVDEWKLKLHNKLKRMAPLQRKAFWRGIQEEASARGLRVVNPD